MAALVIRAIDQETANAAARISPKVIFRWRVSSGMPPMIAWAGLGVKPLDIGPFAAWAHDGRVRRRLAGGKRQPKRTSGHF
jgi:hypothetical protein